MTKIKEFLILFFLFFITSMVLVITFLQLYGVSGFQDIDLMKYIKISVIAVVIIVLFKRPAPKYKKRRRKSNLAS